MQPRSTCPPASTRRCSPPSRRPSSPRSPAAERRFTTVPSIASSARRCSAGQRSSTTDRRASSRMQVVLDASPLGTGRGGDETYLRGLIDGLAATQPDGTTFPVLLADGEAVPAANRSRSDFPVARVRRRPGPWHFGVTLPAAVRGCGPVDLVHSVTHAPPSVWRLPTAMTIGDLSFLHRPQDYPKAVRLRLNTLVPRQARSARGILVPSEFSPRDVIDSYGVDPSRVRVVPNCSREWQPLSPEDEQQAAATIADAGVRSPFIVYIGKLHPRKNVGRLGGAFPPQRLHRQPAPAKKRRPAGRRVPPRPAQQLSGRRPSAGDRGPALVGALGQRSGRRSRAPGSGLGPGAPTSPAPCHGARLRLALRGLRSPPARGDE